jgi:CDP-diacylglycerol--inositol 3-phosphatidyltransferase
LKLYYGNKPFMDLLILGNELFYLLLYLDFYLVSVGLNIIGWQTNIWQVLLLASLPIYLIKQATNIFQLQAAGKEIAQLDLVNNQSEKSSKL